MGRMTGMAAAARDARRRWDPRPTPPLNAVPQPEPQEIPGESLAERYSRMAGEQFELRTVDLALRKWNDFRLAETRLHPGEGAFDIDWCSRRIFTLYVPDDGLEQTDDLCAMGIGLDPSSGELGLAGTTFAGDVARDAFPVIGTDLGGTPVGIRHIH